MGIIRIVGVQRKSQTTPMGEVNPHYRLLRKQYELLKGSLNKVVKYMEVYSVVSTSPRCSGTHQSCSWCFRGRSALEATINTKQCKTQAQTVVPLNYRLDRHHKVPNSGEAEEESSSSAGTHNSHRSIGATASISHLSRNKWCSTAAWAQRALSLTHPPCFN